MKSTATTERHPLRSATLIASLATSLFLGWPLLLATLSFAIANSESSVNPQFDRNSLSAIRTKRASDLGLLMFAVLQLGSGAAAASGSFRIRIHRAARSVLFPVLTSAICYGLVMITLAQGGAPDPIERAYAVCSSLLESAAGHLR